MNSTTSSLITQLSADIVHLEAQLATAREERNIWQGKCRDARQERNYWENQCMEARRALTDDLDAVRNHRAERIAVATAGMIADGHGRRVQPHLA